MKVLVTGGAGFIGSNTVDKLIDNGDKVIVVDNLSTGKRENINNQAVFYEVDIRDEKLRDVFEQEQPEYVIHLAAQINVKNSLENPVGDGDINIIGTINVLECCKRTKVRKVIYSSSAAVYGDPKYLPINEDHPVEPISYYGISKHTPEHYIRVYQQLCGIDYMILRYANVYGIRQDPKGEGGVISIFMEQMFKGKPPIIFGDGNNTRDYIYVDDVVAANLLALKNGRNQTINIGTGIQTSVNKLYKGMSEVIGLKSPPEYGESRIGDIAHSYYDTTKAKDILGFKAKYPLWQGLKNTIEYYRPKGHF